MFNPFKFLRRAPKPFAEGWLEVGNGHRIYYSQYGNPQGKPVLCFHGGPGAKSKASHTKAFDLKRWRVILFDQRGAGQSTFKDHLKDNTTAHLLADARKLLKHLSVEKTAVFGGSWGATLALLFAQANPQMVTRLVVNKVFLARKQDNDWTCHPQGAGIFYPDLMEKIMAEAGTPQNVVPHFHCLMVSGQQGKMMKAFRSFGGYEGTLSTLDPAGAQAYPATPENLRHFQVYMHYAKNDFFIQENQILRNAGKLKGIPTLILHNRLDLVCPLEQAWLLHKALPKSKLVIVPDFGHSTDKLTKATRLALQKLVK